MAGEREDRRVTRTRRLLQEALIALVVERGYAAVTVQQVLDRADIGRATFYSHFRDKESLLLSVFAVLRDALRDEMEGLSHADHEHFHEGIGLLRPLFAHAAQQRRLYRALLGSRDGALLLQYVRDVVAVPLQQHLEQAWAQHAPTPTVPLPLIVASFVSAVLGALVWWVETDAAHTPAEMDRFVEQLLAPGIAGIFNRDGGELKEMHNRRSVG